MTSTATHRVKRLL